MDYSPCHHYIRAFPELLAFLLILAYPRDLEASMDGPTKKCPTRRVRVQA